MLTDVVCVLRIIRQRAKCIRLGQLRTIYRSVPVAGHERAGDWGLSSATEPERFRPRANGVAV